MRIERGFPVSLEYPQVWYLAGRRQVDCPKERNSAAEPIGRHTGKAKPSTAILDGRAQH
jgi:hypothetical protein